MRMSNSNVFIDAKMSLVDSEFRKNMLGLGGAWYMLCHVKLETGCGRGDLEPGKRE